MGRRGMQIDRENREILAQSINVQPMETITGMHAFYSCLELGYDQILVRHEDFLKQMKVKKIEEAIKNEPSSRTTIEIQNSDVLIEKTEEYLCKEFSSLLKLTSHKIDPQEPLEKYGIDSVLAMKFTRPVGNNLWGFA